MTNEPIVLHLYVVPFEVYSVVLFSLWQFCNEYAVPKDKLENFKDVTPQDIVCSQVLIFVPLYIHMHKCLWSLLRVYK